MVKMNPFKGLNKEAIKLLPSHRTIAFSHRERFLLPLGLDYYL